MAKPIMSLEQFAAIEAWLEAAADLAGLKVGKPGLPHAPVVTKVYRTRARAMLLLTGAKVPAAQDDDGSDLA